MEISRFFFRSLARFLHGQAKRLNIKRIVKSADINNTARKTFVIYIINFLFSESKKESASIFFSYVIQEKNAHRLCSNKSLYLQYIGNLFIFQVFMSILMQ